MAHEDQKRLADEGGVSGPVSATADYGNWVPKKLIYGPAAIGLILLTAALPFLPLAIVAGLSFLVAGYFAYARYLFSPPGGNVQEQIRDLVLARLTWDGRGEALDIGCGNGALAVGIAKKYPAARVIGVDCWGRFWEYGKHACERNAAIEGVGDRVAFRQASASALPLEDGRFDVVVSNLTFHAVRDSRDKRDVVREALRVLRKGGVFVFQDVFLLEAAYGDSGDLVKTIRGWGIDQAEFAETRNEPFIPGALKLPFMVGTMGILYGTK